MTSSLDVKPAHQWTDADRLDMAGLIADPMTNGGTESELTAEGVAAQIDRNAPAWGVWLGGNPVGLVGLIPFDGRRGVLHVAGWNLLSHAQNIEVVRGFLAAYSDVEILAITDRPAFARLARQYGMQQVGAQDGLLILRANPEL